LTEHTTTECLLFPGVFDRPVVAKFGRFGDEARHRRRAGMLNPQHPVTKGSPDSVSLTPKQLRPQRVIVHDQIWPDSGFSSPIVWVRICSSVSGRRLSSGLVFFDISADLVLYERIPSTSVREFLAANSTGSLGKPYSARPARWPVPPIQPRAFSCRWFPVFRSFPIPSHLGFVRVAAPRRNRSATGKPFPHRRFPSPGGSFPAHRGQRVERSAATFQVFPKPRGIIPEYLGDGAKIPVLLAGNRRID